MTSLDSILRNREHWTDSNARYTDGAATQAWAQEEIDWGVWSVLESEVCALPDVTGKDVLDLGCGTAYFSAWFTRRGARVVALDPTPAQLQTARRCQREFGIEFPLIEAAAEAVPLRDESFDFVHSEYGASIWADPFKWIPEAARLLRPGGQLVFLRNSTLVILCSPDEGQAVEQLLRPQFGMYRFEWPEGGVEFHLSHGDWIRLLRANGFEVEDLIEIQAPETADDHQRYNYVGADWARRWPSEEIWKARKLAR